MVRNGRDDHTDRRLIMILLILILCILPVALSLDAFEIAQETAGDYRLSAARRFLMSVCFSFFTFIIPVICSVLFRFLFRGLHILDILIPASFIDLLVPLAVLLFFTVTGGKKIIFGYIEYSGRSSPDPESDKKNEDVPLLLLFMQAFASSSDMFGVGLLSLLAEVNISLMTVLKGIGITSGFLFVVLAAGITAFLTFLFSLAGSLLHRNERKADSPQGITGIIGGAVTILAGILLVFM